jgi:hypothetical protein
MALFGLSPLFLSVLASNLFSDPETGLNVTRFLKFHAIIAGCIHLIGAINLRLPPVSNLETTLPSADPEQYAQPDERSALLPRKKYDDVDVQVVPVEECNSALDLLRDRNFWILFVVTLITLGSVSRCPK